MRFAKFFNRYEGCDCSGLRTHLHVFVMGHVDQRRGAASVFARRARRARDWVVGSLAIRFAAMMRMIVRGSGEEKQNATTAIPIPAS